jgi:hypothetical protein
MGALLDKVIADVSKLPEAEQEAFAAWALAELLSERRWDEFSRRSQTLLDQVADEAHEDYLAGRREPLDPETL